MNTSDSADLCVWQTPEKLHQIAVEMQRGMSDEDFLSRGGCVEQKIQEALIGATFAMNYYHRIAPIKVRMVEPYAHASDFEIGSLIGNESCLFEVTTAYPPEYKIRLKYRDGRRPMIPRRAFSGEPIPAEWIADTILNKTAKIREKRFQRHLLVYNNIYGGTTDLPRLPGLLRGAEKIWDSIWVIAGVPDRGWVALVSANVKLKAPVHDGGLVAGNPPDFWGYWIDDSGLRTFDATEGVNN